MRPGPASPLSGRRALAILLGLGTALRVALAFGVRGSVAAAEADGLVRAWTGWSRHDNNRMRPPGWLAVDDFLGRLGGPGRELALRLACVAVSLLALACAMTLVLALLPEPEQRPRRDSAWTWLAGLWAVWPTLLDASVRPVAATATGGALCLLLAALLAWRAQPTPPRWAMLALAAIAAALVGGVPVIGALLVALAVFVLPLPRVGVAGPLLLAVAVAGAAVHTLGRSEDGRWRPEGSAAASALQLTHVNADQETATAVHPDHRASAALANARRALGDAGAALPGLLLQRLGCDLLGAARWPLGRGLAAGLAAADRFLLGAVLLAALLALRRRPGGDGWPRSALGAGLAALALLLVLTATDPWALAPQELLLAAAAAVALSESGGRAAMLAGGVVLCGAGLFAGPTSSSDWTWMSSRDPREGAIAVDLLRDGGPHDLAGRLELGALLTDPAAPFQRLPEAAVHLADAALRDAPDDPAVLLAAARTCAEALDFEGARALASTIVGPNGSVVPEARTTLQVIAAREQALRAEKLR